RDFIIDLAYTSRLQNWGIRFLTDYWPIDTVYGKPRSTLENVDPKALKILAYLAGNNDGVPPIKLAIASALQRVPVRERAKILFSAEAEDHNLGKLQWYGLSPLVDEHAELLASVTSSVNSDLLREWTVRALLEDPKKNKAAIEIMLLDANFGN